MSRTLAFKQYSAHYFNTTAGKICFIFGFSVRNVLRVVSAVIEYICEQTPELLPLFTVRVCLYTASSGNNLGITDAVDRLNDASYLRRHGEVAHVPRDFSYAAELFLVAVLLMTLRVLPFTM